MVKWLAPRLTVRGALMSWQRVGQISPIRRYWSFAWKVLSRKNHISKTYQEKLLRSSAADMLWSAFVIILIGLILLIILVTLFTFVVIKLCKKWNKKNSLYNKKCWKSKDLFYFLKQLCFIWHPRPYRYLLRSFCLNIAQKDPNLSVVNNTWRGWEE